jgi:glutathione peroxidase
MNKILRIAAALGVCGIVCTSVYETVFAKSGRKKKTARTAYEFSFTTLDGKPMPLSAYKGKVLLIVNTASQCGFTYQYKDLEELYQRYKKDGLVIIGVPSNDFGKQEPGTSAEITCFLNEHYPVTFPMAQKEKVEGKHKHPFYRWVIKKGGCLGWVRPFWNFHKYLIDRDGHYVTYFGSNTSPLSRSVIKRIEREL